MYGCIVQTGSGLGCVPSGVLAAGVERIGSREDDVEALTSNRPRRDVLVTIRRITVKFWCNCVIASERRKPQNPVEQRVRVDLCENAGLGRRTKDGSWSCC